MRLNKQKSGIMIMLPSKKEREDIPPVSIRGIPIVNKYKYLGVVLDDETSLNLHLKNLKKKIGHINLQIGYIFKKNSLGLRRNAFEVFINPSSSIYVVSLSTLGSKIKTKSSPSIDQVSKD
jgi:hypothetical protein